METATRRFEHDVPEIARGVPAGLELGLRNYWYPVLESATLPVGKPHGFTILGEHLVAWRDRDGHPHVVVDKCPHRAARLSSGRVMAGDLQCAWHGLRFDGTGRCRLIPWEPEDSKLLPELAIKAYPAGEIGGYVWAYIGETDKFPAPPLLDCVPGEMANPEGLVLFSHPAEVWNCNWLQTMDGLDGYHAVILHAGSQAVANETWTGGAVKRSDVALEDRRMEIVETPQGFRGIALDRDGKRIHHGHALHGWKGERFTLPGLHSLLLVPAPNSPPYASRHYQVPIDATHTWSVRTAAMRATTAEERAHCERLWHEVVAPRQRKVSDEDKAIIEGLGDLAESRAEEFLFQPDLDITRFRQRLADAFIGQRRGERALPTKEALACPA